MARSHEMTAWFVVGLCWFLLVNGAMAQDKSPAEENAIRAQVDKINAAWEAEDGAEIMRQVLSDKAFAFASPRPENPGQAAVFDKTAFCNSFALMLKQNRPRKHVHEVQSITIVGPVAYEIGRSEHVSADGATRVDTIMNVFAKEDAGWRLIFSAPADQIRKALK